MGIRMDAEPDPIVVTFARWLKTLKETASRVDGEHDVRVLEQELRDGGRAILQSLFGQLLQGVIDRGQESLRTCPDCGGRRRHQGVRERRLGSCFGSLTLNGIYWKCSDCSSRQNSVDLVGREELTLLMKDLVLLAGVSSTSFDKGQVVCRHLLTWADVDFEHARLTVHSPKTEHYDGHEQRIIPITPKLMTLLQDRFAEAEEGQQYLVTITGKGAVIRQVRAIWKRAGVEPWKRLWQTLRQSCEKQWAMTFPQYAVSKWIGHSITISGRHYANDVPDELFAKAAGPSNAGGDNRTGAQRHAQQKVHEAAGSGPKQKRAAGEADSPKSGACGSFPDISVSPCKVMRWSRGESNPRPVTVSKRPLHV